MWDSKAFTLSVKFVHILPNVFQRVRHALDDDPLFPVRTKTSVAARSTTVDQERSIDNDNRTPTNNNDQVIAHNTLLMSTTTDASPPENKKAKMSLAQAPDEEWPEAWLMATEDDDKINADPCKAHKQEPNVPVSVESLRKLGINYWKLDANAYKYPVKAVPWDPKDAVDPKLQALRDDRGYSYADIITIHPDHLPEFDKKIASFFEEHIHDAEEIRYILGGSGYFDVRDLDDKWVSLF